MNTPVNVENSDIRPMVREQLTILEDEINSALRRTGDRKTELHLNDALVRIDDILDPED